MVRFIIVATMILGSAFLVVIETKSILLGVLLVFVMVLQWDQARRIRAMSIVLRKIYKGER